MSHRPGIRNFPEPSITRAPRPKRALAAGAMALIRWSSTITVIARRAGAPVASITVTLRTTSAGGALEAQAAVTARRAPNARCLMENSLDSASSNVLTMLSFLYDRCLTAADDPDPSRRTLLRPHGRLLAHGGRRALRVGLRA